MPGVSVGCDPEFVILDKEGLPVPAHSVGIEQKEKSKLNFYYGTAFRDGYNVEINLREPKYCRATLLNHMSSGLRKIRDFLPAGYTVTAKAAYRIRVEEQMKDAPPDVTEFGCSPSLDAYTGERKIVVLQAHEHPWRYAGGHLHFGNTPQPYGEPHDTMYGDDPENVIADRSKNPLLVKLFDKYIGIPLAVIFNDDMQWERRKYYGQAGEYREQQYGASQGVEYRVPPPELFNHTALISLFSGLGRDIITNFKAYAATYDASQDNDIITAINTGDGAEKLLGTATMWYVPETITALAKRPEIRSMQIFNAPEGHKGWNEYAREWDLPGDHKSTL